MATTKVIHLQLLDTDEHYYFGSLVALTDMFGKDAIGITYSSLCSYISLHDYPFKNKKCIIRKGEFHTKTTNRAKNIGGDSIFSSGTIIPRIRQPKELITYSKPSDKYGMLGNMAGGMPIVINGHKVYASEHLYLCGYWSLDTELHKQAQEYCLSQKSGVYAKRCTKGKYIKDARTDFNDFKVDWMKWVVWQKAQQNKSFRDFLLSTGETPIIEVEKDDSFWAAWPDDNGLYRGKNWMGLILTEIRDCLRNNTEPTFNKDLLNKKGIYFLGERLSF